MNPQVGEIWVLRAPIAGPGGRAIRDVYFLLLDKYAETIPTFKMLCLDTGRFTPLHMNFDLDDWEKVE